MLMKTHLALGVFLLLIFFQNSNYKWVFLPVVLIASVIPDIDSAFSTVGKRRIFRIFQWFTKHRGIIHSFTFCLIISLLFVFIYPPVAFPFFLGYGIHLLADSFTVEGIAPFWPLDKRLNGRITTGGKIEHLFFVIFIIIDVVMLVGIIVPFV